MHGFGVVDYEYLIILENEIDQFFVVLIYACLDSRKRSIAFNCAVISANSAAARE